MRRACVYSTPLCLRPWHWSHSQPIGEPVLSTTSWLHIGRNQPLNKPPLVLANSAASKFKLQPMAGESEPLPLFGNCCWPRSSYYTAILMIQSNYCAMHTYHFFFIKAAFALQIAVQLLKLNFVKCFLCSKNWISNFLIFCWYAYFHIKCS